MTPEQIAESLIHESPDGWIFLRARASDPEIGKLCVNTFGDEPSIVPGRRARDRQEHVVELRAVIAAIIAEDRERCAKVAREKYAGRDEDPLELAGRAIAADILRG